MRTEDGYIVHRCLNGDSAAFGLLVDKYRASIYGLAYSKLGNFHDAEDVAQEVFVKAYQNLRTLKRWDSFLAWLYSITSNLCKNLVRTQTRRPDHEFIEDRGLESLEEDSMSAYREKLADDSLHEALDSLPEMYRQVLTLRYLSGMSSVVNGKIYAIGGSDNADHLSVVEEYDPAQDKWTQKADMPTARGAFSTSVVNGKIYAIGGFDGKSSLSVVEEYDPVEDKWTRRADMPTSRNALSTSAVNGNIYAIGGQTSGWGPAGGPILSTVEKYDPIKDEWTEAANMLITRTGLATSVMEKALTYQFDSFLVVSINQH